jgi:hypothetical protein
MDVYSPPVSENRKVDRIAHPFPCHCPNQRVFTRNWLAVYRHNQIAADT